MARRPMKIGERGSVSVEELTPRADGTKRFQARVRLRDNDGKIRQVGARGASRSKAKAALEDLLADRTVPVAGPLSVEALYRELAEMWMADVRKTCAPTTVDTYRRILDAVVLPRFGDLRLREVTSARIAFALDELGNRYTPNGVRQIRKVIAGPLGKAHAWRLLDRNPAHGLGRVKGGAKPARALTLEERGRLLAFVDSDPSMKDLDMGDLVRFLLGTGCRIGEALGLRWRDVDLKAARCHINGSVTRVKGKPLQRGWGKTGAAHRHLWLPEFVVLALRVRWDPRDMHPDMPVFCNSVGTWRDPNGLQRTMRKIRDSLDGLEWMTTHTFRRTAATVLDANGLSPRQIADQMGHARPSMSQDVYMARDGQGPERAASALDWSRSAAEV